jgi:hypothetical protein
VIRALLSGEEILLEQMSGGALARMRSDLGIGALAPRRAAASGWRQPGAWHTRAAWATMTGWLVMEAGTACFGGWP